MNNYTFLAPIMQHADKPHLLFHGAQSTVNSVHCHQARLKTGRTVGITLSVGHLFAERSSQDCINYILTFILKIHFLFSYSPDCTPAV
jgi:hypothetical protein